MDANPNVLRKGINLPKLREMRQQGEKIAMLTCYDASFATLLDRSGVDVLLVGDSLGMVIQNQTSTLPVTMDQMEYHTRCVVQGNHNAWILADMPWASYHESPSQAYTNAAKLLAAGAHMVKIEGGEWAAHTIEFLVERGIPVCAHIGLTPQFIHQLGGYRVQGKTEEAAQALLSQAKKHEAAGADMLLFEAIPATVAKMLTESVTIPTIGIGAGKYVSGQVLVLYDILDIYPNRKARFVKNFLEGQPSIEAAIQSYVAAVKSGSFPAVEHSF